MKKSFKIIFIIAILIATGLLAIKTLYIGNYSGEQVRVNIPDGCKDVPTVLRKSLGDVFGEKVARLWELHKGNPTVSHGSYLVKDGESALRVARKIARGQQTPVRLTFNNLRTIEDLASKISSVLEIDSATFINSADSILTVKGFSKDEMTAAFIPDTYEFYWTVSPEKLLGKLLDTRESFWNSERVNKAKNLGLTPNQVHILASIVEGETNKNDEKGKIARLYLNRIEKDMPLQADPTVKFALKKFDLRRITSQDLKYDSKYNTYIYKGLPPGPIAIAEKRTIEEVLNAPKHNYIYMCAKSDFSGYHDFAETYDKHRINAARYHRALNKRGIKN